MVVELIVDIPSVFLAVGLAQVVVELTGDVPAADIAVSLAVDLAVGLAWMLLELTDDVPPADLAALSIVEHQKAFDYLKNICTDYLWLTNKRCTLQSRTTRVVEFLKQNSNAKQYRKIGENVINSLITKKITKLS